MKEKSLNGNGYPLDALMVEMESSSEIAMPLADTTNVVKNSKSGEGKQRYRCRNRDFARASFILDYPYHGHVPAVKQPVSDMAMNGSGIRDTARVLRISPTTVIEELKKPSSLGAD